jgi:SAM-dependent methyltransferase
MMNLKQKFLQLIRKKVGITPFPGSANYWEARYAANETSGAGSYGELALFKAEVINSFITNEQIETVIDFGCGDGNQLKLANYPKYLGFDVSKTAISRCKLQFSSDFSKQFKLMDEYNEEKADLTLSLDVIYHLIEDDVFNHYMVTIFDAARKFVIIYSTNFEANYKSGAHVKHRAFSKWIDGNQQQWKLVKKIPQKYPYDSVTGKGSSADFYIFKRE